MRRKRFADYWIVFGDGLLGHHFLLNVEPRRDPHILNVERSRNSILMGSPIMVIRKTIMSGVLQQTHPLVVFRVVTPEKACTASPPTAKNPPTTAAPKMPFAPVRCDPEKVRQVAVYFINEAVVVPGLSGPEPLPSGPANKRADGDHRDPQNDEPEKKSPMANLRCFQV